MAALRIGVVKESSTGETRVAATPKTVEQLRTLGYDVVIESGAGGGLGFRRRRLLRGRGRDRLGRRRLGRRHRVQGQRPHRRGDRQAGRGGHADRPAQPGAQARPRRGAREAPDHRHGHGRRPPHLAGAVPRRPQLDGQHRRLSRGDRGRAHVRPVLHRPDHRRGQGAAGQGAGRRRRGGRAGRDRRRQPSLGAIVRATDPRPEVAEQVQLAGREFLAVEVVEQQRPSSQATATPRRRPRTTTGARPRSTPTRRPTSTSSSPPR